MKNVFYFSLINHIGGIETFFYYLAKKYKEWDITIYYRSGDPKQIERLKKYVRVKKYTGEKIKCDKIFFNFNLDIIDNVEAKEYIQIAHGDYKAMGIQPNTHKKIDKYLGVSKQVCETFKEVTGNDTSLVYNPIIIDKPKKILNLISATRLTPEKGKNRIIKLAKMLEAEGIPYIWTIFTDDIDAIDNPNIIYMKPRLDIINYIANADYLVQLSDNEGYCYSVVESLCVGTPVIVTECPVFKEIGVNSTNGFILDFDLKNVPINAIYKGLGKFEYKPKEDSWENILVKGKSTYIEEKNKRYLVRCTEVWRKLHIMLNELGEIPEKGYEFIVDGDRLEELKDNPYNQEFIEIIKEIKDDKSNKNTRNNNVSSNKSK